MSYVVLARKWRPLRFEDLVGQDHVAQTLGNAIRANRVAHAFLFTGVRGVGKTTSARILAKALNCLGDPATTPPGTDPGPTVTPCLACAACREIAQGTDVDVWEIDGASYNGVDEVRKLQDSLPYRPQRDRFKIYVVDEVHMLSQNAWNAFLKTLEEPPPHVKFIFATTEVHKVPVTILSRVQRFDFKLISAQAIAGRLRHVLDSEGIGADDAAISILAREAAGSMRDAMSLLDQVIAWAGGELKGEAVARVLGVASQRVLFEIATALLSGDAPGCLRIVADLVAEGHDVVHVSRDLLALLRDLVVGKVCAEPAPLIDLPADEVARVVALAKDASADDLLRLHQGFAQGFDDIVRSGQARAALEMLLVRLARRPPLLPIDDLVGRLGALERRLRGSAPAARAGDEPARVRSAQTPAAASPRAVGPAPRSAAAAPPPSAPRSSDSPSPAASPAAASPAAASPPAASPAAASPPAASPAAASPPAASPAAASPPAASPPGPAPVAPLRPERARASTPPSDAKPARAASAVAEAGLGPGALDDWRAIVERVGDERAELGAFLMRGALLTAAPGLVRLGFGSDEPFITDEVTREAALVERAASAHFGTPTSVRIETGIKLPPGAPTLAHLDSAEAERKRRTAIAKVKSHPRVVEALEVLGGHVKDLKLAGR